MGEPSRNAPCPCGSGEKYRRCCGPKDRRSTERRLELRERTKALLRWAVIGAFGAAAAYGLYRMSPSSSGIQPWQYDATNNRHWNPRHEHWHDGPPPAGPR